MALIKSKQDILALRAGGKILAQVLRDAAAATLPGVSLLDLNTRIHEQITASGSTPAFLGFDGFPFSSCLSLNSEVVHGIPDERILTEGDILGIDVGLWHQGLCVDAAVTVGVGTISDEAHALLEDTHKALLAAIKAIKPFRRVGVISQTVGEYAEKRNRGIVRSLTGHGVGHKLHEEPSVPNFGRASDGILLRPGMVLAIEPMLTTGSGEVYTEVDGWTVSTVDHSLSAQFEHTVLVTSKGAEILTV